MKPTNLSDAITHLTHLLKSEFDQQLSQSSDLTDLTTRLAKLESDMPCSEDIASLDDRVTELENYDLDNIQSVIESLGNKDLEERLESLERELEEQVTAGDERLTAIENEGFERLKAVEEIVNTLDQLTPADERLDSLEERLESLEKLVNDQNAVIFALTKALLER